MEQTICINYASSLPEAPDALGIARCARRFEQSDHAGEHKNREQAHQREP